MTIITAESENQDYFQVSLNSVQMDSQSPPATKGGSPIDMDKLKQKLQRAYLRRDHYAQLYYETKTELEDTRWQLSIALNKIKQLQSSHMSKYKTDSLDSRTEHISPPDRNGKISPDSGAISMSPGVESTEGHGQIEDEIIEGSENRSSKNNNRMNGGNEALNQSGDIKPVKKVAFRDAPPLPSSSSNPGSYERMNGTPPQPVIQRSYTYDQGEMQNTGHYMDGMNMKMQRTASYSQGRSMGPPMTQFSTFPGNYPIPPHHLQQQKHYPSTYSLPPDQHRLPRVHRGMNYDGNIPPPMMSPPYQQAPPPPRIIQQQQLQHPIPRPPGVPHQQQSAFQRVPKQGNGGSFRMHHQYENVIVHPSYYPLPPTHPAHMSLPSPHEHHQQKQPQYSYRGSWVYSGLSHEEFSRLLDHLSLPNTKVERLEIARSNLGKPSLMNSLCKELEKNASIIELSLPSNEIGKEVLKMLLTTVAGCKNIKELRLGNNNIGEECLDILKEFLDHSNLTALTLSGNEIEHHTHLLDALLPQELQYEGGLDIPSSKVMPPGPYDMPSHNT